ncbi:MAG: chemotaxis protein CheX [Chitinispirillia bacterium]|nr:chemotaxis protein CheX [Chitinispirillia bacterium]MCL2242309.1 chemotaxis protein CheX [Chitinispirillia bacterium]
MNVQYINPFINATAACFKNMILTDAKQGAPTIKKEPFPRYDISGIIGLSGGAQGSISLCFPMKSALDIVSAMVGAPLTEAGVELADAVGEIANIIAGFAKRDLAGLNLSISLPNVIISSHVLSGLSGVPTIIVPFTCPLGPFAMEISLKTS